MSLRLRHKELRNTKLITKDGEVTVDKDGHLEVSEAAAAHLLAADKNFVLRDSAAELGARLAMKKNEMGQLRQRAEVLAKEIHEMEMQLLSEKPAEKPVAPPPAITPPAPAATPAATPPVAEPVITEIDADGDDEVDVDAEDENGNTKPFKTSLESKLKNKKNKNKK